MECPLLDTAGRIQMRGGRGSRASASARGYNVDGITANIAHKLCLIAQAPVHESSLLEGHPPFARLARSISIQSFDHPRRELLPHLGQILAQEFCIQTVSIRGNERHSNAAHLHQPDSQAGCNARSGQSWRLQEWGSCRQRVY
jgi:hypothetical protein